jgi:hypothetical protein
MWEKFGLWVGIVASIVTLIAFFLEYGPKIWGAKAMLGTTYPKISAGLLIIAFGLSAFSIYLWTRKANPLHWTMTQDQEEVIYGKTFRNETIEIDGKKFDHCRFENVTLIYHALAPADFVEATWSGNVYINTDNDAAKGFIMLTEQMRQTMAHLPNMKFGVASLDKNGNIVPLPDPSVRVNK